MSMTDQMPSLGNGGLAVKGELVEIVGHHFIRVLASRFHTLLSRIPLANVLGVWTVHVVTPPLVFDLQRPQEPPETAGRVPGPDRINLPQGRQRPTGTLHAQGLRWCVYQFPPGCHLLRGGNLACGEDIVPKQRYHPVRRHSASRSPCLASVGAVAHAGLPNGQIDHPQSGEEPMLALAYRAESPGAARAPTQRVGFHSTSNTVVWASCTSGRRMP